MMAVPFRLPFRAAVLIASVAAVAALGVPTQEVNSQATRSGLTVLSMVAPSPVRSAHRPESRLGRTHKRQKAERDTRTPPMYAPNAAPSMKPTKHQSAATPPSDIRIDSYQNCSPQPQHCIDAGTLTMYAQKILAGHDYMGYQWLSRVPIGHRVRINSGPLEGTYKVYDHLKISRQHGFIPTFPGSPSLILQTCEGHATAFSLLHRL